MSVAPLVFELIIVFCVSLFLLHHYGRISKQHPVVTIATLIAWYFSLIIIFILPLDVSSAFYRQCVIYTQNLNQHGGEHSNLSRSVSGETNTSGSFLHHIKVRALTTTSGYVYNTAYLGNMTMQVNITDRFDNNTHFQRTTLQTVLVSSSIYNATGVSWSDKDTCEKPWSFVPENTLPAMWRIVYWTSQILTWLVLPFMQSYSCAGDFSSLGKVKRAVIENAFYYGTYLLIFGGLLIYVAVAPNLRLDITQLKVILITASNTWGLFLLVLLLGYGLVEVPRGIWHAADHNRSMARTHFQLAKLCTEKQEAKENLDDILEEIKRVSHSVRYNHPVRKYINIVISKCPTEFQNTVSQGMDDYEDYEGDRSSIVSAKSLVRIHRQLIQALHTHRRTNTQWNMLMQKSLHLENISNNRASINRQWKEEFPQETNKACVKAMYSPTLLWYWYCVVQPKARKVLACCLVVFSAMVVWSECTFFNEHPVLSLFAIFINIAKSSYNYFYIELASCLTISYLCICAYSTVFRIKLFNYYYIAGHHQTDESSLLFVGIMLCRLTAPLCLNFLLMIHLDTDISSIADVETSYTKIMGHLHVISFISDGFNVYFPILVCVLCIATYFSLGQRCLSAVGFQKFIDASDDLTTDLVDEGRQLVNREKRQLQRNLRALQRMERMSEFGHDGDMATRQWRGKNMRNAQNKEVDPSGNQYTTRKKDKIELLDDVEPIDYNSVADRTTDEDRSNIEWERSTRWNNSPYQTNNSSLSTRPPKNLFDDV